MNGVQEASSSNLDTRTKNGGRAYARPSFFYLSRFEQGTRAARETARWTVSVSVCVPASDSEVRANLDTRTKMVLAQWCRDHFSFVALRNRGLLHFNLRPQAARAVRGAASSWNLDTRTKEQVSSEACSFLGFGRRELMSARTPMRADERQRSPVENCVLAMEKKRRIIVPCHVMKIR